jgi:hypothetical protein
MRQNDELLNQYDYGNVEIESISATSWIIHDIPQTEKVPKKFNSSIPETVSISLNSSSTTILKQGLSTQIQQKLACPFYQRDPWNHSKFTSCSSSGFDTVHRVK